MRKFVTPSFPGVLFSAAFLLAFFLVSEGRGMSSSPDSFYVGLRTFGVWEPLSEERFDFSVWYPSRVDASQSVQEGWLVEAGKRGRILPGFFPVVLLSHDTASGRFANNDLAFALAASGMIVIAPTHTADNQNSSDGLYSAELLRDRPRQLLHALETVLASVDFAPHVDESRIGLVGVGFGAISVLQLAGAVPDFSRLSGYCASVTDADAFCASWTKERLGRLPGAMSALTKKMGHDAFAPSLAAYAPELIRVPLPRELQDAEPAPDASASLKPSLWNRLFGSSSGASEEGGAPSSNSFAYEQPQVLQQQAGDGADAGDAGKDLLTLLPEFKDISLFGTRNAELPFTPVPPADLHSLRDAGAFSGDRTPLEAPDSVTLDVTKTAFRRLPQVRKIRGVALLAPAGGMLFSQESLGAIRVPVAVIEAGKDGLYPPERHAQPFFIGLPIQPFALRLPEADHFSLFAQCSKDTLASLGEACGRITGDARLHLAEQRDHFLVSFFQSVLGGALPPVKPSGYVAVTVEP